MRGRVETNQNPKQSHSWNLDQISCEPKEIVWTYDLQALHVHLNGMLDYLMSLKLITELFMSVFPLPPPSSLYRFPFSY